jgi:hypothetical protein
VLSSSLPRYWDATCTAYDELAWVAERMVASILNERVVIAKVALDPPPASWWRTECLPRCPSPEQQGFPVGRGSGTAPQLN